MVVRLRLCMKMGALPPLPRGGRGRMVPMEEESITLLRFIVQAKIMLKQQAFLRSRKPE